MIRRLYGWLNSPKHSFEWKLFVETVFSHEDFLPPLHQPNILPELSQGILLKLSELDASEYDYRQKEEAVLKTALLVLTESISSEPYNIQMGLVPLDFKESVRLHSKIEQLILNKGYSLHHVSLKQDQMKGLGNIG